MGQLTIVPAIAKNVEPGRTFYLGQKLTSHLGTSDTFEVHFTSARGRAYTVYSDPDGDGDPSDGVPLFDTNGNGTPDIIITSEGQASVVAVGTVPAGTPFGTVESLTLLADGNLTGSIHTSVLDRITVQDTLPAVGGITGPTAGACFGPSRLPVVVTDDFTDQCDPNILRTYDPSSSLPSQ